MTCQPTADIGIFPFVTFQTHSHLPVLIRQSLQVLDLSVAFPASHFFVDMTLVVEQDMFRNIVNFDPGGWCLGVEVLVLLLDLRVSFNDIVVAVQTFFHRRNARKSRVGDGWVAELALDLLDAAVYIVAKGDGLFRAETG